MPEVWDVAYILLPKFLHLSLHFPHGFSYLIFTLWHPTVVWVVCFNGTLSRNQISRHHLEYRPVHRHLVFK